MNWERWIPKEPLEWVTLALHLFVLVYAIVFEVAHFEKTELALVCFIVFINIVWTISMIIFIFKKYAEADIDFKENIKKQDYEVELKEKSFLLKQTQFELREKTLNDSLVQSVIARQQLERKAKYADILKTINGAFGEIHRIMRELNSNGGYEKYLEMDLSKLSKEELKKVEQGMNGIITKITQGLIQVCNQIESAFRILTGDEKIAVCIKGIVGKNLLENNIESCYAITLLRDHRSNYERGLDPLDVNNKPILHYLTEDHNTSFSVIIKSIRKKSAKPFFCNVLPLLNPYENSSFNNPKYGKPTKRPWMNFSDEQVIDAWTLPYRACIVYPLLPDHNADQALDKLEGFLCVDSYEMNVFNESYDPVLLAGLSDGVYNKIHLLNVFIEKSMKLKEILETIN